MTNITGDVWRKFLAPQKLEPATVEKLTALLRPQIKLIPTGPVEEDETPPWTSKLGGFPDLPVGADWPLHGSLDPGAPKARRRYSDTELGPLEFLAQVNLADVARVGSDLPLPTDGLLLFFYDAKEQAFGFDPADGQGRRVIYVPAGVETKRQMSASPDEILVRPLEFAPSEVLPDWLTIGDYLTDPIAQAGWRELEGLDELFDEYSSDNDGEEHVFGGWPRVIQHPMEEECESVLNGLYLGGAEDYKDPRITVFRQNAPQWRLLLQLDSDESLDWMWGDMGMVYFWCREEDIAARRFDRVWTILQCG